MIGAEIIAALADLDPADKPAVLDAMLEAFGIPAVLAAIIKHVITVYPAEKPDATGREWLTPEQAATELRYSRPHIYELIKDGRLKCMRDPDKKPIRTRREWLDEFIREREMRGPVGVRLSNMLNSKYDRADSEAPAASTRTHSRRARTQAGRALGDGGAVGNRSGSDS
jgi:excisionase family DNA binding protein